MKKRVLRFAALLLIFVFALSAASCGAGEKPADALEAIRARGELVIATEGNWAPWTYHDGSNALVGLDVEIGRLIADGLGVKARFEETDWDSILAGVEAGRFDIACNGVTYTEERAQSYRFTAPYVYSPNVLVVRKDNTEIASFADLRGKTTANTASSTYAAIGERYGASVTPVDDLAQTIELVLAGRIDATINAKVSILDYLSVHPDAGIKIVATEGNDAFVIPAKKGDSTAKLVAEIDRILEDARKDGRLGEISKKYFGEDLTHAE